ncbi:hypothetical protein PHLCEN_2v7370 [Hermanssonia centrifuga]|uniref:Uncharacterized protein n=1 Tax=Hermanssonia centrifuga TaxID=98765 RepID=A0A2R6NX04_9APHY|nr:hypothetical protein PHLCEN_2v7370 [Hermanssonia centrifuga]
MSNKMPDALNIVFISLSVSGQLNIHLASIEHMLTLGPSESPPLNIHLISFDPAEKRARTLAASASPRHSFTFHGLGELTLFTETSQNGTIDRHRPAELFRKDGLKPYTYLAELFGYNPDHYIRAYERILEIFREIKPKINVAAVDTTMPMAMDACTTAGIHWGVLCPNSGIELFKHQQPRLEGFWKHPAIRALEVRRSKAGIQGRVFNKSFQRLPFFICSSVMEMEFPHIPSPNVVFPGPILVPVPPLSSATYPDLTAFFDRKRTVIINLGSNFWYSHEDVESVADAILDAQQRCQEKGSFQVLWKLNGKKAFEIMLEKKFGKQSDTVRIDEWIEPDTLAVLQHPNVVAFVNHGGASNAGVPQILLPQWLDLYEYAVRTEWLGHGIYANKGHPAEIVADQLADAFLRVLSDDEGKILKAKSLEIAEACRRGGGVQTVARTLLAAATI